MSRSLILVRVTLAVLTLAACGQEAGVSQQSCSVLRQQFGKSFQDAISAGVRKSPKEQDKFVGQSQKIYRAMENQGCCRKEGVCPPLNVH